MANQNVNITDDESRELYNAASGVIRLANEGRKNLKFTIKEIAELRKLITLLNTRAMILEDGLDIEPKPEPSEHYPAWDWPTGTDFQERLAKKRGRQ